MDKTLPPDKGPPDREGLTNPAKKVQTGLVAAMELENPPRNVDNDVVSTGEFSKSGQTGNEFTDMDVGSLDNQGGKYSNMILNDISNVGNSLQCNKNNSGESVRNKNFENNQADNECSLNEGDKRRRERLNLLSRNRYQVNDHAPYYVYVEHLEKNLGRLFPVRVGHFLFHIEEFRKGIKDIVAIGLNRVKIIVDTYSLANKLVDHPVFIENKLKAYIPLHFTQKKGVIKLVDTKFDEEYLWNNIKSDHQVVDIKRLKRKIVDKNTGKEEFVNRQMIVVTFVGSTLPDRIRINVCYFPVEPWIHPVVQCFSCLRFGHVADQCRGGIRCSQCGEAGHDRQNCLSETPFCIYCSNNSHHSTSKTCPAYLRQRNVKTVMASENLSFKEAERVVDNPSYAKVATYNRFSVLNNEENFPSFPKASDTSMENHFTLRRPKVIRPLITSQTNNTKKRKTPISPVSPTDEPQRNVKRGLLTQQNAYSQEPPLRLHKGSQLTTNSRQMIHKRTPVYSENVANTTYKASFYKIRDSMIKQVTSHFDTLLKKLLPVELYNETGTRINIEQFFSSLHNLSVEISDDEDAGKGYM